MIKNKDGFSLVELLVAAALLLIILGPLLSFMRSAQELRSTSYRLTDVEQNARAALLLIGRDLQNAGYNFPPKIDLATGTSNLIQPLLGAAANTGSVNNLYPIIPGDNVNTVNTTDSATGATVSNATDQITLLYTNQIFNNGLPVVGRVNAAGTQFTLLSGNSLSASTQSLLYQGDFCVLNTGQSNAIGIVNANTSEGATVINFSSGAGLNTLDPQSLNRLVTLYTFHFVTYFVDSRGNLIRREHLSPPHSSISPIGDPSTLSSSGLTSRNSEYSCGSTNKCYHDNIIATGIEDLQFTYFLTERKLTAGGATLTTGPVDDPGFYGSTVNQGNKSTEYRLLDIRRVNVSIKARAQERDAKLKDPYNKKMGYLYRFSLDGSYNTRNFYGSNYKPLIQ
jgi:prepilin-type N-terminal cleavage/methylation domain-containing protein